MKRVVRNRLLLALIVSGLVFAVLAAVVPTAPLIEVLNGVFLALAVIVGVVWLPDLVGMVAKSSATMKVRMLGTGIACVWISVILQRVLSQLWRYLDRPEGWSDNIAWALAIWIAMMGAVFHITASGVDDNGRFKDPERLLLYIGLPISIVATIALLVWEWRSVA